jgi:hypothetical protein
MRHSYLFLVKMESWQLNYIIIASFLENDGEASKLKK